MNKNFVSTDKGIKISNAKTAQEALKEALKKANKKNSKNA